MKKETFYRMLEEKEKIVTDLDEYQIILLINAKTNKFKNTKSGIYYANEIEAFSHTELIELFSYIQSLNMYVDIVYDEYIFIQNFFNNKYNNEKLIVHNLSRNGRGRTKKSFIPSFCEFFNIIYTSSDSFAISFLRNKFMYFNVLNNIDINVPKTFLVKNKKILVKTDIDSVEKFILKPCSESASQGIHNVSINSSYKDLINSIDSLDVKEYILQEFIEGYEIEVPALVDGSNVHILGLVGIMIEGSKLLNDKIITEELSEQYQYTFYNASEIEEIVKHYEYIVESVRKVALVSGAKNYFRVDFRIKENSVPYITDIATTPYMIDHSSFKFISENLDISYSDIFKYIVLNAIISHS